MAQPTHTLTDGTTIKLRLERGIIGTVFHEVPSRKRRVNSAIMWQDGRMYLLTREGQMVRIINPKYEYAETEKDGAKVALSFFVDSAEACIKEAEIGGFPVEDCYSV